MSLKQPKIRSEKHRRFIASLPCVACRKPDVQAAHIRSGNDAGMGLKSGDNYCVPLCVTCHRIQGGSERDFWKLFGGMRKATKLAKSLYNVTGNKEEAMKLIGRFR